MPAKNRRVWTEDFTSWTSDWTGGTLGKNCRDKIDNCTPLGVHYIHVFCKHEGKIGKKSKITRYKKTEVPILIL